MSVSNVTFKTHTHTHTQFLLPVIYTHTKPPLISFKWSIKGQLRTFKQWLFSKKNLMEDMRHFISRQDVYFYKKKIIYRPQRQHRVSYIHTYIQQSSWKRRHSIRLDLLDFPNFVLLCVQEKDQFYDDYQALMDLILVLVRCKMIHSTLLQLIYWILLRERQSKYRVDASQSASVCTYMKEKR